MLPTCIVSGVTRNRRAYQLLGKEFYELRALRSGIPDSPRNQVGFEIVAVIRGEQVLQVCHLPDIRPESQLEVLGP